MRTVELPEGIQPDLAPLSSPIGEIYRVYLKSDKYDAMELRTLEDWVVERNLKMVPGVADVVTRGGFIKQYQVVAGHDEDEVARRHACSRCSRRSSAAT